MQLRRYVFAFSCLFAVAVTDAAAAEVCTVLADADSRAVLVERGDCTTRVTPASTFKIAIGLMGYDTGFLKDEHTPALPFRDGYVDWRENWKHPADPARWMRDSVVWYSQQVTQGLGAARFAAYTRQFDYGNADVSAAAGGYGWYVGWAVHGARTLVFARLISNDDAQPSGAPAGQLARDGFLADFPH